MHLLHIEKQRATIACMTHSDVDAVQDARTILARNDEPAKEQAATKTTPDAQRIGAKLRHARLMRCLSLRSVANAAGCSESFVSKIENGKAQPSLSMLSRLVGVIGADMADIFSPKESYSGQVNIVRADATAQFHADTNSPARGITMIRLSPSEQGSLLQTTIHIVPPGAKTDDDFTHEGEEVGYVLEGAVDFTVDGDVYKLGPGDSLFYPSHLPHGYQNHGSTTARILWTNTPPAWRRQLRPLG